MASRVTVNLGITADASQAKRELQSLQNSLQSLSKISVFDDMGVLQNDLERGVRAATNLKAALSSATNVNTGQLNLSKFSQSLTQAGTDLGALRTDLSALGPQGNAAFQSLCSSILMAEKPIRQLDGLMGKFLKGLGNTFMWTLQSNAIHGFQSALSSAYSYAQQLNKGLTDISIVSDLSSSQLAKFAKTANQYARELSSTTNEYVKGALIFYQQGLSDDAVIERTNTTIKMAQASGESAEAISSYMTAIWNNFADGTKELEYYADVISLLGAETAASNADIAEGMQAFAATANTVGLSFEYAASALTTLRDVTQQSASTIGNSLKTIFARLSSVAQGDTLEDGVDLTKYSKALDAVGVSVLDTTGELRDMDSILDDLAEKWDNLTNAQKVALAQTVGGVRQYNNLISLMDNYERFQELVQDSYDSTGYLNTQADKYADSWEGASNRVRAAWEKIYALILNDKALVKITSTFAKILDFVGGILDGMGGIKGLLPTIANMLSTAIKPLDIGNTIGKLDDFFHPQRALTRDKTLRDDARTEMVRSLTAGMEGNPQFEGLVNAYADATAEFNSMQDSLTEYEKKRQQAILEQTGQQIQQLRVMQQQRDTLVEMLRLSGVSAGTEQSLIAAGHTKNTGRLFLSAIEGADNAILGTRGRGIVQNRNEVASLFLEQLNADPDDMLYQAIQAYVQAGTGPGANKRQDRIARLIQTIIDQAGTEAAAQAEAEIRRRRNAGHNTPITPTDNNNNNQTNDNRAEERDNTEHIEDINEEITEERVTQNSENSESLRFSEQIAVEENNIARLTANTAHNLGERNHYSEEGLKAIERQRAQLQMASNIEFATTIISGLTAMGAAFDALWENIATGQLTISSFIGSIGSFTTNLVRMNGVAINYLDSMQKLTARSTELTKGTELLGKAATFLTKHLIGCTLVILGVVAAVKLGAIFWKKYQESLPENKLKKTNEQLEKQKTYVSELTNEYDNLRSTLNSLTDEYDELNKKQKGTLDYLMALEAWNSKLAELEKKYGVTFETDENGAKILDEDKLTEAASRQLSMAQAERQTLEIKSARQAREIAETQVFGSAIDIKEGLKKYKDVSGAEAYKINGEFVAVDKFDKYVYDFMTLAKEDLSGDDAEAKIRAVLKDADDNIVQFFLSKLQNLNEAIQTEQKVDNFSNLVGNTLRGKNIYAAAAESGHNSEEVNAAINAYAEDQTELYREESKAINYADAIAAYEQTHNVKYSDSDDKFYELTESGEIDKDKPLDIEVGDAITAYITSRVIQDLQNLDADKIADIVNKYYSGDGNIINEGVIAQLAQEEANRKQLIADTKIATELGFDKEEYQQYVEYLQKIHENLAENQKQADEIAIANMRLNRGVETLIDNFSDWKDILDIAREKGNEWTKDNKDYQEAIDGITEALEDIANTDLDNLDPDFILNNLDLIQEAAYGDADAIDTLIHTIAADLVKTLDGSRDVVSDWENDILAAIDDINFNSIEIDTSLAEAGLNDLYDILYELVNASEDAANLVNGFLSTINFEPMVETREFPIDSVLNATQNADGSHTVTDSEGNAYTVAAHVSLTDVTEHDGVVSLPVIRSANQIKSTGGTGKNLSASNRKKGASNRAKSNSGSSKKPKTADTTRYHEINSKLEQTSHYLDMVNTAEERAYGQKKLDLMDEKIKLLEREAEQYKQLYDEAKRYYDQDRDRLQNQYGAAFNADGSIANYDAWYKQFVDRYNAGGMDDDAWSAFEDAIKKYEDSLKHLNDAEKKYQDDLNKIFDQKLEKIEYRLKTITDIIKLDMDYLDYMIEMLDDDGLDTAEAMAYIAKEIADVTDQYTANKQALADIFKNHEGITDDLISGLYNGTVSVQQFIDTVGNFTEKEIESIKSIMSSMYSNGKDLKKYIEDLYGKLGELSDKFQESLDKQIDKLDHMNDIIDKTRNIIDVMGKDTLGISDELLNRMQRAQIEISKEHLATLMQERDQYKLWIEQLEAQYAIMDPDSLEAKAIKEQIEAYQKVYEKVEKEILDTANMTAEQIQQLYIKMIEQTVTEAGNKIAGAVGDFEKLMDAYDRQKDLDNLYLKTYEKTYQTNKLLRDIGKSLDDTANLGMQGKLRDLQEEILGYQQEGKQVTEEQMEERRKYYELLLAEAALEEAQNAKNMVRMTRDNEGNWSYTYTADQGQLDDLMNDYNDKLFAYEDYNQKTLESAQDTLLNLQNEYLEALKNAHDEAEVQALQAYYEPMIEHQRNMVDYILMRNNELADNFNVNADEVATKLSDTVYGVTTGFDSMDKAMATFDEAMRIAKDHVIECLQGMDAEQITLANSVDITAPEVEQKLDDIEQGVKDVHTAVAGDGTDENPGIAKDFDNEFNDALDTLKDFHETMGPIIDGIIEDIGKINNKVTEVISAYSELSGVTITPPDLSGAIGAMNALKAAADGARDAMREAGATPPTATPTPKNTGNTGGGGGGGGQSTARNKNVMARLATGGYTGAFGPEGRMAILHEKELVLNKADTQNLLTTVSFVRDLTRMISLNAADASSGLGNLFMGGVGQGGGYLDQTVTIHAEFPNATNHSEIEEAFSNLIGLASQYAGRKR